MDTSPQNILIILRKREYGFYHHPHRTCAKIIRSLLYQPNTMFHNFYRQKSSTPIYVVENNIYTGNFSKGIACQTKTPRGFPLFTELICSRKIIDFQTIHAVDLPFAPNPPQEYRNAFYSLERDQNQMQPLIWLVVRDIMNGKILRQISLVDARLCKLRDLSFHNELDRIYLTSSLAPKSKQPNVLFSVIAFEVLPLKLMGSVDITLEIFGKGLRDIDFNNDLFITLYGSNAANCRVRIFDFNAILCDENKLFDTELDKYCPEVDKVIGQNGNHIPVNYKIAKLPPILLEVNCCSNGIDFSLLPKVFFLETPKQEGQFEIRDIYTYRIIGCVGRARKHMESMFHIDNEQLFLDTRERVIYQTKEKVQIYSIDDAITDHVSNGDVRKKVLNLRFELSLPTGVTDDDPRTESNAVDGEDDELQRTSRRLPVRRARIVGQQRLRLSEFFKSQILAMHYNNVLELFVVFASVQAVANTGICLIYDAINGRRLVQFYTSIVTAPENMYNMYMFYEMIFLVEFKLIEHRYHCYAFSLCRDSEEIDRKLKQYYLGSDSSIM